MPNYTTSVSATSNGVADTEDTFVEILAAASSGLRVKRVKVYNSTAAADTVIRARLVRASSAGATGVAGTAAKKNDAMRASSATVNIKNGASAFSTGSVTDVVDRCCINGRSVYEWIPRNESEEAAVAAAVYFKVLLQCSAISAVLVCTVEWED